MLASLLAEGHPIKLREAVKAFECAGFASEAAQARAKLPKVASAFLAACMAESDYNHLTEAILAAEAEGISCADARTQLEALVGPYFSSRLFCFLSLHSRFDPYHFFVGFI